MTSNIFFYLTNNHFDHDQHNNSFYRMVEHIL